MCETFLTLPNNPQYKPLFLTHVIGSKMTAKYLLTLASAYWIPAWNIGRGWSFRSWNIWAQLLLLLKRSYWREGTLLQAGRTARAMRPLYEKTGIRDLKISLMSLIIKTMMSDHLARCLFKWSDICWLFSFTVRGTFSLLPTATRPRCRRSRFVIRDSCKIVSLSASWPDFPVNASILSWIFSWLQWIWHINPHFAAKSGINLYFI